MLLNKHSLQRNLRRQIILQMPRLMLITQANTAARRKANLRAQQLAALYKIADQSGAVTGLVKG